MNGKLTSYTDILNPENFVKFPNADKFTELDKETRDFLKNIGVYGNYSIFPFIQPVSPLERKSSGFIKFGQNHVDDDFCINTETGHIVGISPTKTYVINSSLEAYMDCCYVLEKYMTEVQIPGTFGPYWKNLDKYADKLTELLTEVEPDVTEFHLWGSLLEESRAGLM